MKNLNLKISFFTFLLSGLFLNGYSQQKDSLYYLSGQVVQEDGISPVSFAHVINVDRRWGVVSDTLGFFSIWVMPGDTLNVSALGYYFNEFQVQDFYFDTLIQIPLQHRTYEIPEARITYLGTYKDFEYKVLNLKLPDIGINDEIQKMFKQVEVQPVFVPSKSIMNPASLIYSMFTKEGRDIHKYIELTKNQDIIDDARKKYNVELVQNLTGLDELSARKFMTYCNFTEEYIVSITDYKLYERILEKLEAFKNSTEDSLKSE